VIPARNLHASIAQIGEPLADILERIEGRRVAYELGQKYSRPLDLGHENALLA
jgi:hypothetical protein